MITAKRVPPYHTQENDVEIRLSAAEARVLALMCDVCARPESNGVLQKCYNKALVRTADVLLDRLKFAQVIGDEYDGR